jgi:hypothetical protein
MSSRTVERRLARSRAVEREVRRRTRSVRCEDREVRRRVRLCCFVAEVVGVLSRRVLREERTFSR